MRKAAKETFKFSFFLALEINVTFAPKSRNYLVQYLEKKKEVSTSKI